MRKATLLMAAMVLGLWAVLMLGCSESTSPDQTQSTGQLRLNLVDAPGDYDEVNIEVVRVEVHRSGADSNSGWMTMSEDTLMVDLLELSGGNSVVLADSTLETGHYTQIRLVLGENNTVVVDSVVHELEIPSGSTSGLKLNHPFTIEAGLLYEATLDFDADRSIHVTGNGRYKMKPVIRVIVSTVTGSIRGVVNPVDARARVWTVAGEDTVVTFADTLSGDFDLRLLPDGNYDLRVNPTAGAWSDSVIADVMVAGGQETDVGLIELEAE